MKGRLIFNTLSSSPHSLTRFIASDPSHSQWR